VTAGFSDVELLTLRLFDEEMVGVAKLRLLGDELYRDIDPTEHLSDGVPLALEERGDEVVFALTLPEVEPGEVDVVRKGDEVVVTVGGHRRGFVLPDSLRRRDVLGAKLVDGVLEVRFGVSDG
jgi:arsenite-transporting ATPase